MSWSWRIGSSWTTSNKSAKPSSSRTCEAKRWSIFYKLLKRRTRYNYKLFASTLYGTEIPIRSFTLSFLESDYVRRNEVRFYTLF
mmetsp:Transcript_109265/g.223165  ORF Transcript_109265/g.223165 Transcript_109265/m.223165 type:complete len:85 (+) Transcript_109265:1487-1741(+)